VGIKLFFFWDPKKLVAKLPTADSCRNKSGVCLQDARRGLPFPSLTVLSPLDYSLLWREWREWREFSKKNESFKFPAALKTP
jgi:hypothetical protein